MDVFFLIVWFVLGTIIGSFLNVVILRYNTGFALSGRSGCLSCGKKLEWYELVPVVSYFFLRGKCSLCKSPISIQYPLVEIGTGILFAMSFAAFYTLPTLSNISDLVFYLVIISILMVITVYDIRHTIIPDGLVYAFIIFSLIRIFFIYPIPELFHYPLILELLAGPILFLPFFLLWFVSKGRWMGFGDAKLALGIGFLLGLSAGISAIILAFWIGAIVSLIYLGLGRISESLPVQKYGLSLHLKHLTIKSEIPFAPYLILGTLLVLFFGIDVLHFETLLGI